MISAFLLIRNEQSRDTPNDLICKIHISGCVSRQVSTCGTIAVTELGSTISAILSK
jgi:hypothetical protein